MRMSPTEHRQLAAFIRRAPLGVLASAIALVGSVAVSGPDARLIFGGSAIGVVAASTLLLSYRYHGPLSWLFCAVPVPALWAALLGSVASDGSVSVTAAMFQSLFPALMVALGGLWLFRHKVLRWVA